MRSAVLGAGALNLCRFGVIVLLAKFASPEMLGQYQLSLAISAPIVLFLSMQLRGAFVADAQAQFTYGTYRTLRTLSMLLAAAILLSIALIALLNQRGVVLALILAGVAATQILLSVVEFCWGIYQRLERLDWYARSNLLLGAAMILPAVVLLPAAHLFAAAGSADDTMSLLVAVSVWLSAGLVLAIYFLHERPHVRRLPSADPGWTWDAVRRLTWRVLPLGFVLLVINLCEYVPQWVVGAQERGLAALGFVGALAYVTFAGNLVVTQIGQAASNQLARSYADDLPAFRRLTLRLVVIACAIGVGFVALAGLAGTALLRLLYTSEYAAYSRDLVLFAAGRTLLFLASIFGIVLTQTGKFWVQVPLQLTILAGTTAAALLLIPENPVSGAGWTVLVRGALHAGIYAVVLFIIVRARGNQART